MHIVTGGAGFLGSALVWQLNEIGLDEIVVVDNLGASEKWRNLVKRKYCDYIHRDVFLEMVKGGNVPFRVDSIVHLGACSSTTERDCDFLMRNNVEYSKTLCRFALERGVRFINASSAATYGGGEHGFSDDPALIPVLRPLNMYGYSKQLFDLWLMREKLDGSVASLKFFNVYGPNEYHKGNMASVACKLYDQIKRIGRASLFASNNSEIEDGAQRRDFVYVKDCARLMAWLMLEQPRVCGIRNVGTGRAETFRAVAVAVFAAMKCPVNIDYAPMPATIASNYQNYTCADMDWLTDVGYAGEFAALEQGIEDYVRNYLATSDRYL